MLKRYAKTITQLLRNHLFHITTEKAKQCCVQKHGFFIVKLLDNQIDKENEFYSKVKS